MQVWKYPLLCNTTNQTIALPDGARALCVQMQNGSLYLWALVEHGNPVAPVFFDVIGTGHDYDQDAEYVGTAQDGQFVWHVFRRAG